MPRRSPCSLAALPWLVASLIALSCTTENSAPGASNVATGGTGTGVESSGGSDANGTGGAAPSGGASTASGGSATGGSAGEASGGSAGGGTETPVELGDATVWIAGDSTVANGNTPCPVGWGKGFDALFDERITVVNSAVGGRSIRTWLYDVTDVMEGGECVINEDGEGKPVLQQRWVDMLNGMKEGDFLLIQFGINDGSPTCPRHVGLDAFKQSYTMMAEAALERGAQPVLLTPVSAIACNGSAPKGTRGGFVQAVIDVGATLDVPVIDLHARSVALYGELGFCPVPGGDVSATTGGEVGTFFCDDHTHFDTPGALQIGELVAQGLKDEGVSLAEYLK